jgi:hypothetical protein
VPCEAGRAAVDPRVISEWLTRPVMEIHGIPRGLGSNMDETGCSDWANRPREVKVIVPACCQEARTPIRFDCNSK